MTDADTARRFGGVGRLYGAAALARFAAAHVGVIGIGGVGSWAAEALARSGVGRLTLIDLDHVCISNVNRQVHAVEPEIGAAKVAAMATRIRHIHPDCRVTTIEEFVTPDNLDQLLTGDFAALVDAIDAVPAKVALAAWCRRRKLPLVMAGGAGGQLDPTRVRVSDLARTEQDPLLAKVRSRLRRDYGFPRDPKKKFGIDCVWSDEPLIRPPQATCDADSHGASGLNCAGFGSSVCVTATFGLAAAARVLQRLAR